MTSRFIVSASQPPIKGRPLRGPEEMIQRAVKEFLDVAAPDLLWWAVPNGGVSKGQNGRNKAMGARAGVPDLHFLLSGGKIGFIEMKAPKGVLSLEQKTFRAALPEDAAFAVCRSVDEVATVLRSWGVPLRVHIRRP